MESFKTIILSKSENPKATSKARVKNNRYYKSLIFTLILLGLTFYYFLGKGELTGLLTALQQVNLYYIGLGLLGMVLFFLCQSLCIRLLLGSFRYELSYWECARYSLIDFYFSSITPACCGGQPSQIYYMKKDGIEIGSSSLAILIFNLAYHLAVLIVAGIAILFGGAEVWQTLGNLKYLLIFGALAQAVLVVLFVTAIFSKRAMPRTVAGVIDLLYRLKLLKDKNKIVEKFRGQVERYREGARHIRNNPGLLVKVLVMAVIHIVLLYSTPYWVYKAFGLQGHTYLSILAMQAALTLAMETLPIPGGIGVAEGGFVTIYGMIFGRGKVVAAMLLCRGISYYFSLVVGFAVAFFSKGRCHSPCTD